MERTVLYISEPPLYINDSTSLLNTTVSTKYVENKRYQSNRRAGSFKHKIGLFSHWSILFNSIESIFLLHTMNKKTPNTSRPARLQWGKARSSVKPGDSHSHEYYSHFLNRKKIEVTKKTSLTGSKSSGGIFILLLQADEGKQIPFIFITISSTPKWEKKKWRILSLYSYSVSLLYKKKKKKEGNIIN